MTSCAGCALTLLDVGLQALVLDENLAQEFVRGGQRHSRFELQIHKKNEEKDEDWKAERWITGSSGRGRLRRKSPKISSQYLASLYCCSLLQWFSNDRMIGKSDVINAVSRIAKIAS